MEKIVIDKNDKILIIAPHPDDESIGMGGFLGMFGKQCDVWLISDGSQGRTQGTAEECVTERKKEFYREMEFYGVNEYRTFDYPDSQLSGYENALQNCSFDKYTKVFTVNAEDISVDHRATYRMTVNALIAGNADVELYQYEVTYPLRRITHYLDISDVVETKKRGMSFHQSQMAIFNYSDTAVALNRYRATWYDDNILYAEAFCRTDLSEILAGDAERMDKELQRSRSMYHIESLLNDALLNGGTLKGLFKPEEKIYLYGYGVYGKKIEKFFEMENVNITAIIDRDATKAGTDSKSGISIISLDNYISDKRTDKDIVIITVQDVDFGNHIKSDLVKNQIDCMTLEELLTDIKSINETRGN